MQKKGGLIINADDWGMSGIFNDGILELVKRGVVTSVTVMIKEKHLEPEKILFFQEISVGLHLDLKRNASLKEAEAQIGKFIRVFGKKPSHLDGHQHCHLSLNNLPLILKVAKKYNLSVRSRFLEDRKTIQKEKVKTPDNFISWHPARSELLVERLLDIKNEFVTELVCHPGYFDKNCGYPYNQERKKELKFLKSVPFGRILNNFNLKNYYEL